jgi:outer membrane receptor protein involved in Fe transport
VDSHDEAGPSEVPTRSYTLVDAGAAWRLAPQLELVGSARNLLNEAYQSSSGPRWVWAPGRHASIALVVKFAR